MKFSSAAVLTLLATPAAQAFVPARPQTVGVHTTRTATQQHQHRQQQQQHAEIRSFSTTRGWSRPTFLRSTTSKRNDVDVPTYKIPSDMDEWFMSSTTKESSATSSASTSTAASAKAHVAIPKWSFEQEEEMAKVSAVQTRASTAAYLSRYQGETGASIVYSKLLENGVTVVNGFSGGAVLPLLDHFHPQHPRHKVPNAPTPIRWITNSNESSAGHIAEGYAKSMPMPSAGSKDFMPVGVVVATSGPGVTNLITPLQDAICDGVPILVLCGQAATVAPPDAFQSSPAVALTRPCTKWSYQIRSAAEVPLVMDYAFFVARQGRPGPVFIDLPKDLLGQKVTSELIDAFVNTNLIESSMSQSQDATQEDKPLCRLVRRRRTTDGRIFQALHLGVSRDKGLSFEVVKQSPGTGMAASSPASETYKLLPVSSSSHAVMANDIFHADHHPTNQILKHVPRNGNVAVAAATTMAVNGVQAPTTAPGQQPGLIQGPMAVESAMMEEVVRLIRSARRPVIIAGQGCNDATAELKRFAETLQIPVATTLHALGCFDERHPLALNMLGMHGHPTPNFMVQEADLIICIGSRFDDRITGRMSDFVPQARRAAEEGRGGIIHVDIRLSEHAKQVKPTYFVHSTGRQFLQTMNDALASINSDFLRPTTGFWLKRMRDLQRDYPIKIPTFPTEHIKLLDVNGEAYSMPRTRMSAQTVVTELNKQILEAGWMDQTIFTTGVGVHQMIAAQLITWTQPRQMLSSGSLGTMGVSLGYCIGAKLANPTKMCISVDGDGSFNMTFTELKTLAEQHIPIKIMILDNDGQMMVEYWQRLFHENRLVAVRNSGNPDYSMLAKAFGIKSLYCDSLEDMPERMRAFLFDDPDKAVLFHVRIERTPCLPLVAPGQPLDDMILEDVAVDVDGMAAPS